MDLGGLSSKIASKADLLGMLGGVYMNAAGGGQDPIGSIQYTISQLLASPHVPNIGHVFSDLTRGWSSEALKTGFLMWLGGTFADDLIGSQWSKILREGGMGVMKGTAFWSLLRHCGEWHSGGEPAGQPYGGHNGYPRGAGYSPLGRRNGGYFTMPTVPTAGTNLGAVLPASPKP